jgi:hypothetical protein
MGIWNKHWANVNRLLSEGRPEITHTIDRIIQDTGTTDKQIRPQTSE